MSKVRSVAVPSEEFSASVASTALASSLDAAGRLEKSKIAVNLVSSVSDPKSVIILPENFDVVTPFYKDKNLHKGFSETGHLVIGSYTGERFYNMYFLEASKNRLEFYKKQLLMPLGEYNIYIISTILKILNNEDWLESYNKVSHRASKSSGLLNYNDVGNSGAVFGASVCSENISPYIYRDATKFGATVLVNIASHAPFHGSVLLARQTISISKARALENGRYFIVASNFSNSFVISDRGDLVIISDDSHKSYFLNSKIKIKKYITPYVYFGDYVAIISFSVLIIFLIWKKKE
jgi:apolipoprotein N-acyltransferase